MPAAERKTRPGRRRGETVTRDAILESARRRFTDDGYGATSVRQIARDAGVDPALIAHFFGSKAGLFLAAVPWPVDSEEAVRRVLEEGPENAGRRLAEGFILHWGTPERRNSVLSLISVATVDPEAAALLRDFLMGDLLLPVLDALGADHRALRAGLCNAQLCGMGLSRYVFGLVDPAEVSDREIVEALSPTLQRYLTGSLFDDPGR